MMTCVADVLLIQILLQSVCAAVPALVLVAIIGDAVKRRSRSGTAIGLMMCCTLYNWTWIASFQHAILKGHLSFTTSHQTLEFSMIVPLIVAVITARRYAVGTGAGTVLRRFIVGMYAETGMALILLLILVISFVFNSCGPF